MNDADVSGWKYRSASSTAGGVVRAANIREWMSRYPSACHAGSDAAITRCEQTRH
ncbi:hypothetical protein ACFYOT_24790 [Saccharothrix saharensis]|uniref:hypothetical protein n=1 Tax=Saccharothrix saharensis TaxID=571190 RepID=UPI00368FFF2E